MGYCLPRQHAYRHAHMRVSIAGAPTFYRTYHTMRATTCCRRLRAAASPAAYAALADAMPLFTPLPLRLCTPPSEEKSAIFLPPHYLPWLLAKPRRWRFGVTVPPPPRALRTEQRPLLPQYAWLLQRSTYLRPPVFSSDGYDVTLVTLQLPTTTRYTITLRYAPAVAFHVINALLRASMLSLLSYASVCAPPLPRHSSCAATLGTSCLCGTRVCPYRCGGGRRTRATAKVESTVALYEPPVVIIHMERGIGRRSRRWLS